jgi:hypothetical protein
MGCNQGKYPATGPLSHNQAGRQLLSESAGSIVEKRSLAFGNELHPKSKNKPKISIWYVGFDVASADAPTADTGVVAKAAITVVA